MVKISPLGSSVHGNLNRTINFKELTKFLHESLDLSLKTTPPLEEIRITDLHSTERDTLNWCNTKNIDWSQIKSALIFVPLDTKMPLTSKTIILKVSNPRLVFTKVLNFFFKQENKGYVDPTAHIGMDCKISDTVNIGRFCIIGDGVVINSNTIIRNNVEIESNTTIGEGCTLESGCLIGGQGFGYEKDGNEYIKLPHIGSVEIGNNVDIGAYTCINRGTLGVTKVSDGVKIDAQSFLAHNVTVGTNTVICSHVVICGSASIGNNVWIAPGSILRNKITIGDHSTIGLGSTVVKNVPPSTTVKGNPAK